MKVLVGLLRRPENPVLRMVHVFPFRGFGGISVVAVPALAGLEGRSVEMKRYRWVLGRIPNFVVSNIVCDVG